jgi:hypothetical protein
LSVTTADALRVRHGEELLRAALRVRGFEAKAKGAGLRLVRIPGAPSARGEVRASDRLAEGEPDADVADFAALIDRALEFLDKGMPL